MKSQVENNVFCDVISLSPVEFLGLFEEQFPLIFKFEEHIVNPEM